MIDWQPIETASKDDGSGQPALGPVILLSDGDNEIIGRWFGAWEDDSGEAPRLVPGRWVDATLGDFDWEPTRWCPVA